MNPFGHFDDSKREYVITRPDTPTPWFNYLGQEEFFGLCADTAGGYTFWKDAKLRRLTRYRYNNVPCDLGYIYVNDGGAVWNPGWRPTKSKLDAYECRHGLGYARNIGQKNGLEVEVLFFAPPGENLELWKVTVRNKSKVAKQPKIFSFQDFWLLEAANDNDRNQRPKQAGRVEIEGGAIYHETRNHGRTTQCAVFACTRAIEGFDTRRDAFIGAHRGLHDPKVPFTGACTNTKESSSKPIAAHQVNLDLAPGQEETFAYILACVQEDPEGGRGKCGVSKVQACRRFVAKYGKPGEVDAAFAELLAFSELRSSAGGTVENTTSCGQMDVHGKPSDYSSAHPAPAAGCCGNVSNHSVVGSQVQSTSALVPMSVQAVTLPQSAPGMLDVMKMLPRVLYALAVLAFALAMLFSNVGALFKH